MSRSRRSFLKGAAWLPMASLARPGASGAARAVAGRPHVVVVGAGAFGGWAALLLRRRGARVTLLDAWGPGNSRASSGGETRVIRATYGDRIYIEMVARSFEIWQESERRWGRPFYQQTGAIWMVGDDDSLVRASRPVLRELGFPFEELSPGEAARRYPQVNFEGVRSVHHETRAGYLLARRACEAVVDSFREEGGEYRAATASPGPLEGDHLRRLAASDGEALEADAFVFACGPWLGPLFPDVLGGLIRPTRQEVYFFGTPAGDARFGEDQLPVWVDLARGLFYGIPGNERRGFKVADDARGVPFDPTAGDRIPTPEGIRWARDFVAFRFPALKGAPLLEARVCQYENSPDHHLIIDRHPRAENVWLVGGGSGHGFKLGPAVGERVAEAVLGRRAPDAFFGLARFAPAPRRPEGT